MAQGKQYGFVKNPATGVVFRATPTLKKMKPHFEPCNEKGHSAFDEVDVADEPEEKAPAPQAGGQSLTPDGSGIIVQNATKKELMEYAYQQFGEKLNGREPVETLRQQVTDLIEAG